MWSAEDKQLASAEYAKFKRGKFGDEDDNDIDYIAMVDQVNS